MARAVKYELGHLKGYKFVPSWPVKCTIQRRTVSDSDDRSGPRYQAGYNTALADLGRGKVFAPRATDDARWAEGYRAACAANGVRI